MNFNILRKDRKEDPKVNVVIISAACCMPGLAAFDEQARLVVDQAIAETEVAAAVKVMPATTAFFGGAPRDVMAKLMTDFQSGKANAPAILVDGRPVSYGVPTLEQMKVAIVEAASAKALSK